MALQEANQAFLRIPSKPENASQRSRVPSNDPPPCSAIGHLGQVIHVPDSRDGIVSIGGVQVLEVGVYCRLQRGRAHVSADIGLRVFGEAGRVNAHAPQHTRGANPTVAPRSSDGTPAIVSPAGLGRPPGLVAVDGDVACEGFPLGVPEAGEVVADRLFEKRFQETLHAARKPRMVAVVGVRMSNAHERWPEGPLATLGNDDLVRAGLPVAFLASPFPPRRTGTTSSPRQALASPATASESMPSL